MATLVVQSIPRTGLEATYAAATSGGDEFPNDERTFFHIKNADAGDHTVTFTAQKTAVQMGGHGSVPIADIAVIVTAAEERMIAVPPASFNDGNGRVQATYDAVTSVTVAAIRQPAAS